MIRSNSILLRLVPLAAVAVTAGGLSACSSERNVQLPVLETVHSIPVLPVQRADSPDLLEAVGTIRAHDFAVSPSRIAAMSFEPVDLGVGLIDADALVLLVNHPGYRAIDLALIREKMRRLPVIFDVWGLLKHSFQDAEDLIYLRLGNA